MIALRYIQNLTYKRRSQRVRVRVRVLLFYRLTCSVPTMGLRKHGELTGRGLAEPKHFRAVLKSNFKVGEYFQNI